MRGRLCLDRIVAATVLAWAFAGGTGVHGQAPANATTSLTADPIACWWKTDKDAVLIAEQFTLTLTCRVRETGPVRAVADPKQFDGAALPVAPFEVVVDTPHADVRFPPWRYFQHEYTVRLLKDGLFGQDVEIPGVRISYTNQSTSTGEAVGPERHLVLPPLPIRVVSLVPKNARGIRDTSNETFGASENLIVQARGAMVAAGIFFAFALVFVGLAAKQMAGQYRQGAGTAERPVSSQAVVRGCLREATLLRAEVVRNGWTEEGAGRALALFRVAAAVAMGRRVAQNAGSANTEVRTGQLVIRQGVLGRKRTLLSASTTPAAVARQLRKDASPAPRGSAALEELEESLRVFSAVRYGVSGPLDAEKLDAALENGSAALRRLKSLVPTVWLAPFARLRRWHRGDMWVR